MQLTRSGSTTGSRPPTRPSGQSHALHQQGLFVRTLGPCASSAQRSCSDPRTSGKGLPEANARHMQRWSRQGLSPRSRAEPRRSTSPLLP